MVISIFYAVCGLSVLFFAAFLIQCCRSAARKTNHIDGTLPTAEIFDSDQTARLLAQWEQEMAEFMARQGRKTAPLFVIVASSVALLSSAVLYAHSAPKFARVKRSATSMDNQGSCLHRWEAEPISCKKN